jgi:hypothetical protein|tara:strand:- start:539 stop:985 length:447 start_codon:yes stop_codon:yes gene_type:complete
MARLTVNEAGMTGYTDEIILTPGDFTTAAGNTTTLVNVGVKAGDVIDGAALVISEAFSVSSNVSVGYDGDVNPASGSAVDEGFVANSNANTTQTKVNTGSALDDGGDASNVRIVAAADGNVFIKSASALDVSTSGKMKVLLSIKRVNA